MTKILEQVLERRDTFIVQSNQAPQQSGSLAAQSTTHTVTLPGGHRVHVVDRAVFDRAVKAAMQERK